VGLTRSHDARKVGKRVRKQGISACRYRTELKHHDGLVSTLIASRSLGPPSLPPSLDVGSNIIVRAYTLLARCCSTVKPLLGTVGKLKPSDHRECETVSTAKWFITSIVCSTTEFTATSHRTRLKNSASRC